VAEWSIAPHSKCGVRASVPGVRIPPSPPDAPDNYLFYYRISQNCLVMPQHLPQHGFWVAQESEPRRSGASLFSVTGKRRRLPATPSWTLIRCSMQSANGSRALSKAPAIHLGKEQA
jgi:hypothetical protein